MADIAGSIFNKKAADKLRSADDLEKYMQVTNPSGWVVFVACATLLAGLLAWGIFGAVTASVTTTGVLNKNDVMCFLSADDAAKVDVGDIANIDGQRMEVADVAEVPLSREEASGLFESDYLASTLVASDWVYKVTFNGNSSDLIEDVPLIVNITTEHQSPVSLILKRFS